MTTERPILFSAPMVRALLAGTKTQTRRSVKPQPGPYWRLHKRATATFIMPGSGTDTHPPLLMSPRCPYGRPGDRLWVREGFSGPHYREAFPPSLWHELDEIHYWADGNPVDGDWTRPRPSIHMPRWASRILLEVVAVSVERLKDISAEDAIAEGMKAVTRDDGLTKYGIPDADGLPGTDDTGWPWHGWRISPIDAYRRLWEQINGAGSWAANPWVWVVEFRRILP